MVSETIHGLWWRRPGRARCSLQSLTAPLPFTTTKSRKEKLSFANIPSVLRTASFLHQCHWRGICSQYADVPTLLEKSARNNAKFCQIESRRRRANRTRWQLKCPEWHFLKKGKKQRSLTGKVPQPSNQKQNVGPLLAQYKPCGLDSWKIERVQSIVISTNLGQK